MLNKMLKEKLDTIFMQRLSMTPIKSFLRLQQAATPAQILELNRLSEDDYFFIPIDTTQRISFPRPHGRFLFVIPSFCAGKVYCGVPQGYRTFASDLIKPIQGHTSICIDKEVYFAGEINFINGSLKSWSNNSGHYMPDANLADRNFIPAVKLLLPPQKFKAI